MAEKVNREETLQDMLNVNELDTIIESVSDGIYVTDGSGKTLRVNSAFEKITGIKAEMVLGRSVQDLLYDGVYSKSVTLMVLKQKMMVSIMERLKIGKEVLLTGIPVFNRENDIVRVVTTIRDLAKLNSLRQKLARTQKINKRYQLELSHLRRQQMKIDNVVVFSKQMKEIMRLTIQVANVDSTVLITGESGVGKEVVARAIHQAGKGNSKPFIVVNCGAIPENLLESELFGYEKGAFTGANKEGKPGLFELAEGGSLFLDEIGELSMLLQTKLLRAVQEKEITRVGGVRSIKINMRIIASTNRNLKKMVKEGKFRHDLFYRLNVVPIHVPPICQRRESIIPMLNLFLNRFNKQFKKNIKIDPDTLNILEKYDWPGNIREMENLIERLVVISDKDIIDKSYLPEHILDQNYIKTSSNIVIPGLMPLEEAVKEVEKQLISTAFKKYPTTRETAKALGVSQATIVRKMQRYALNRMNKETL